MVEAKKKERKIPWYITAVVLMWALTSTIYTVASAATNFTVKTPYVADLFAGPADIKVEAVSFQFNTYTNRYENATMDVRNTDATAQHSGSIQVTLYSADNTQIAQGSGATGIISPGVMIGSVLVQMVWTGSYSASDFARGKVILSQVS